MSKDNIKPYAKQNPQQKITSGRQYPSFLYIEKTKNLEQKVFIILRLKSSGRKLLKILRVCIYIYIWFMFVAYTCGWGSLPVRFKINFLEPCWVFAPPGKSMPSVLLVFVQRLFLLIVYKLVLRCVVFNCLQGMFQYYFRLQFYLFMYFIYFSHSFL